VSCGARRLAAWHAHFVKMMPVLIGIATLATAAWLQVHTVRTFLAVSGFAFDLLALGTSKNVPAGQPVLSSCHLTCIRSRIARARR